MLILKELRGNHVEQLGRGIPEAEGSRRRRVMGAMGPPPYIGFGADLEALGCG